MKQNLKNYKIMPKYFVTTSDSKFVSEYKTKHFDMFNIHVGDLVDTPFGKMEIKQMALDLTGKEAKCKFIVNKPLEDRNYIFIDEITKVLVPYTPDKKIKKVPSKFKVGQHITMIDDDTEDIKITEVKQMDFEGKAIHKYIGINYLGFVVEVKERDIKLIKK